MAKSSAKTTFSCQSCGYQSPKWLGKCPECGQWDSFAEEISAAVDKSGPLRGIAGTLKPKPVPIDSLEVEDQERLSTRIAEFDRVLGGGLVAGSLVLIGGDPGIGKSTLMLQALHGMAAAHHKVLYVSGEESVQQLRLRSRRLAAAAPHLLVVSEIHLDAILQMVEEHRPDVLVIDSIQTMYSSDLTSAPGSVSQVRDSAMRLMLNAKKSGVPTLLVGHVTKEGAIAGPKLLEHMVDTVLYFEGDRNHVFRILRAVKNRFGSTNEIGVFEMQSGGLAQVPNPSAVFLSERPDNAPGSVVTATMEGTRPILVELQALASSSNLGTARRTVLGLDPQRVALLVAVMEKKLGLHLIGHDIFINVAGGVKIDEPSVDLAVLAAIASSFLDKPVAGETLVLGEVGLAGEVRAIGNLAARMTEAAKMGFHRCLAPRSSIKRIETPAEIEMVGVGSVAEAMEALF
ncbi:MAG: DNA repair protein RadA [Desulfobacteraceae bacterium]|nr:MAG: DNA repair protein RadA [Desulfobacteraceae bacterium]